MLSIITFIAILSILILVHEFGHFITAKKSGVLVEEFGIGLPPRLFGIKYGETYYSINILPIGGFVKVLGEEREDLKKQKLSPNMLKRTFAKKKPLTKLIIIGGGVLLNFVLGWVILSYLFTQGVPVPTKYPVVEKVLQNSPAEKAGLRVNDKIFRLAYKDDVYEINDTQTLITKTKSLAKKEITISVLRGNNKFDLQITPRVPSKKRGGLGIIISGFVMKKYSVFKAPIMGLYEAARITGFTVIELGKTIVRVATFKGAQVEVAGPIGIASLTSQASKYGINAVLQLLGILSLNLAVVNFLPFPALDGGRFVMILYEVATKRRVNPSFEKRLNILGFALLMGLLIIITVKDIQRIF